MPLLLLSRFSPVRLCNPIDGSPPGSHPWDSPGKNTGVGCHFLLQCMKVKHESEVAQSCLTLQHHGLRPIRLLRPRDFPGKSTGVGCHCLLQSKVYTVYTVPKGRAELLNLCTSWYPAFAHQTLFPNSVQVRMLLWLELLGAVIGVGGREWSLRRKNKGNIFKGLC